MFQHINYLHIYLLNLPSSQIRETESFVATQTTTFGSQNVTPDQFWGPNLVLLGVVLARGDHFWHPNVVSGDHFWRLKLSVRPLLDRANFCMTDSLAMGDYTFHL